MEEYAKNGPYPFNLKVPGLLKLRVVHTMYFIMNHTLVYLPKVPRENPIHINLNNLLRR